MSWPVPNGSSTSGLTFPPVVLPWAAREEAPRPLILAPNNSLSRRRKVSILKVKYGSAMLAGLVVASLAKKIINSVPIVNILTRPILDLVPTIIVGPALGAAVMYGIEQGDLLAARHVVREKAQYVRQELDAVVRDLSSELQQQNGEVARQLERSQGVLESTARAAAQSVAEMERTIVPVLEREYRVIEAQTRRALQEAGGSGGRGQ